MKSRCFFAIPNAALSVTSLVLSLSVGAQRPQRSSEKYLRSEPHPETICTADSTCGSASDPCTVDIKRTASDASVTPSIPNAKTNMPFSVKVGTQVAWRSPSRNRLCRGLWSGRSLWNRGNHRRFRPSRSGSGEKEGLL